jgi:hypothetical protein
VVRIDDDGDDDECKPDWPSAGGLWAISQGGETYSHQPHAPFIEAQQTLRLVAGTDVGVER